MYETILVAAALQRWERYSAHALAARDVAVALARSASKPLHVLSAYEYPPLPGGLGSTMTLPTDVAARWREQEMQRTDALLREKMDAYVAPLLAEGLSVSTILRVGSAREVIVHVATELHADVVVIGSHSKRGLIDTALGGTAQHVMKHAPCPVILVSPKR
jgi:nucleotide-binding universal stress UspA family protein